MARKVDGSQTSLIQGVSQQNYAERIPGQCTEQVNMTSDPVLGLSRRAPTELIAELSATLIDYDFTDVDLGPDGQFVIAYKAGSIRMFDLAGIEVTVNYTGSAASYITGGNLSFVSFDGDIYIADRGQETAMSSDTTDSLYTQGEGLVFLLGGQYGRTYEVTVEWGTSNSETFSFATPDGSAASHMLQIATDNIMEELETAFNANATLAAAFTATRKSDVLLITPQNKTTIPEFTLSVDDGDGGANIFALTTEVGDTGDLPRYAPANYLVKIAQSLADEDDYYLAFTQEDGKEGFGKDGIWKECAAPGVAYKLDLATWPHVLTYDSATDEFTLSQGDWADRPAGDDNTNPPPDLLGHTINDLGSFQGRLVLLGGPYVQFSQTNDPTNIWKKSATTLLDTDAFSITSSVKAVADMLKVVPHDRDLVVFSEKAEFIVFGRNAITPTNSSLVLTTSYEADLNADPKAAGRTVFFAIRYGSYTGIKEFFTDSNVDANNARSVTTHVNQYIQGRATQLVSSTDFDLLLVRTDNDPKTVYVYQYVWLNGEKAQSAWHKWTFSAKVRHAFFNQARVVFLMESDAGEMFMEVIDLERTPDFATVGNAIGYQIILDRKSGSAGVNLTLAKDYHEDGMVYVQGAGCPNPGMRAKVISETDTTVTFGRDMEGGTVFYGIPFESRWEPTRPVVRDNADNPITTGDLSIMRYLLHYTGTGAMSVSIESPYYDGYTQVFTGRVVGAIENVVGVSPIVDGMFDMPFGMDVNLGTIAVHSDSFLPMTLQRMEWEGLYVKRGTRV